MKTKLVAASLAVLGLALSIGSAAASTGYVTDDVNVRAGAGTGYDVIGHLSEGEEVEIIDCEDGWCLTDEGYVSSGYLAVADAGDDEDEDDDITMFDSEEGEFDFDPYDLEDDVPESIHDDF